MTCDKIEKFIYRKEVTNSEDGKFQSKSHLITRFVQYALRFYVKVS